MYRNYLCTSAQTHCLLRETLHLFVPQSEHPPQPWNPTKPLILGIEKIFSHNSVLSPCFAMNGLKQYHVVHYQQLWVYDVVSRLQFDEQKQMFAH